MAVKQVHLPSVGKVTLTKKRGNSNIRLSYARDGSVRVSLPYFVPYQAGIEFVKSRIEWLEKHRPDSAPLIENRSRIGKAHQILMSSSSSAAKPSVRVSNGVIKVIVPTGYDIESTDVQQAALRGARKALKAEADNLLPQRLQHIAVRHGFNYNSVSTKRLTSRWGSCSQHKDITLNIYLMQLSWDLIDYVIIHELVHTEHLDHSVEFWNKFESVLPGAKSFRKELKKHKTEVTPQSLPGISNNA